MNRAIVYSILLGITALTTACNSKKEEQNTAVIDSIPKTKKPIDVSEVMGIAIIEPLQRISNLSAESGGVVRSIDVQIGQKINKGQVILTLDNSLETAQMAQSSSKVGTQQEAIVTAQENLNTLQVQLKKAKADLQRNQELFKGNALTKQALEDSQYAVENLEQQIRASQTQVKQAQAKINELKSDINYYSTLQNKKTVRASQNGTLLSLDAKVGQYLASNQSIGDFAPEGPVMALTEIDELFAMKIKLGQKAIIRPQGSDEILTTGTVVLMSSYLRKKSLFSDNAANLEDRRVREIRVQLDDPTKVLLGARVECVIAVK